MNARHRAHFEKLLLAERERLQSALDRIAATAPLTRPSGAPAPGVEFESGSAGGTPEDDDAIAAREAAALAEIDHALRVLHEEPDRYGICVTCGRPIPTGRLEIVPATRYCERDAPA